MSSAFPNNCAPICSGSKACNRGMAPRLNAATGPLFVEGEDSSTIRVPAARLIQGDSGRNAEAQAARLAHQFLRQNDGLLRTFCSGAAVDYDGSDVYLTFVTDAHVGAVPLLSPTSGRPEIGFVVRPRFEWPGIGAMLAEMGWRVVPQPLRLPLLPGSERRIPPWVLATIVLSRIQALLAQLERRFEVVDENRPAPRGTVDWARYATAQLPRAHVLDIPCRFPDLRDDRELKAAIHYTLRKQLVSLEGQRAAGPVVAHLIALCQRLLENVRDVHPRQPAGITVQNWLRAPLRTEVFRHGLQAIEWTVDDRGLAGLADLRGLPWLLSMDEFFEAWVETVAVRFAQNIGGTLAVGRRRETIAPLSWTPPYRGSQRYLLPDLVLETEDTIVILDAKYKRHWEELHFADWADVDAEVRERHRADILQVLAYSTLKSGKRIVSCLIYPCRLSTWHALQARGAAAFHATVPASADRQIEVVLTGLPLSAGVDAACRHLHSIVAVTLVT